jgi:hypothetical protein
MATRLENLDGQPVWNPPDPGNIEESLNAFCEYLFKGPKGRSAELDADTTRVCGPEPGTVDFFAERGRSALYASAYLPFMEFIEKELNSEAKNRAPDSVLDATPPKTREKIAKFRYETWGAGYNWLQSNRQSAGRVKRIIESVIGFYKAAKRLNKAEKVLVVTHSMGGLVARSLCDAKVFGDFAKKTILGVVHTVQPAAGAATTYKRMRAGFEGVESVILGRNSREVTAILSKSQGGLELLPFAEYNGGEPWLFCPKDVNRAPGNTPNLRLPRNGDPYTDIYTSDEWYGLVPYYNLPLLKIAYGTLNAREEFNILISRIKEFHESISDCYHPSTYALWSRDASGKLKAWGIVTWRHRPDHQRHGYPDEPMPGMGGWVPPGDDDNHLGTVTNQYNLVKLQSPEAAGDGTVPADASAAVVQGRAAGVRIFGPPLEQSQSDGSSLKPEDDDREDTGCEHSNSCNYKKMRHGICEYCIEIISRAFP